LTGKPNEERRDWADIRDKPTTSIELTASSSATPETSRHVEDGSNADKKDDIRDGDSRCVLKSSEAQAGDGVIDPGAMGLAGVQWPFGTTAQ
jgi:hypothetical protein